jgi:hypothetical protein
MRKMLRWAVGRLRLPHGALRMVSLIEKAWFAEVANRGFVSGLGGEGKETPFVRPHVAGGAFGSQYAAALLSLLACLQSCLGGLTVVETQKTEIPLCKC